LYFSTNSGFNFTICAIRRPWFFNLYVGRELGDVGETKGIWGVVGEAGLEALVFDHIVSFWWADR
jgi:hypothetical protein